MTRELSRLAVAILMGFALIAITSAYWSIFQYEDLLTRPDNPRRFPRGLILDRNGIALASSRPTFITQRTYPYGQVGIGYFSNLYGTAGLEAAFDDLFRGELNGRDPWAAWRGDLLLAESPGGYAVRSTIDLPLQQLATREFNGAHGAAIIALVPSGEVLALVSSPTFDPNFIDQNWHALEEDANSPLLNRARQGLYQPGNLLRLLVLGDMLDQGASLEQVISDSQRVLALPPLGTMTCDVAANPRLIETFAAACPYPFADAFDSEVVARWGLLAPVPLHRMDTSVGAAPSPDQPLREALGQGRLTVTPLHMARTIAAIANRGTAPGFFMADAYRLPGDDDWHQLGIPAHSDNFCSPDVAEKLVKALRYSANHALGLDDPAIHAISGTAQSGSPPSLISWFLGFVEQPDNPSLVITVVVEDADTTDAAAQIAEAIFRWWLAEARTG